MKQTATAPRNFAEKIQVAEAWLQDRAPGFTEVTKTSDYALWFFNHSILGSGMLELIDNAELSQGGAVVVLSAQLMVSPPQTLEEALAVLRLNDWPCGCTIVLKDLVGIDDLMIEGKFPLEELSCARIDKLLRVLTDGKHYLES
ncbi:MAG: hypothetical protein ACI4YA_03180 [Candidatus Spyradenecus sp.]